MFYLVPKQLSLPEDINKIKMRLSFRTINSTGHLLISGERGLLLMIFKESSNNLAESFRDF